MRVATRVVNLVHLKVGPKVESLVAQKVEKSVD